MRRFRPATDFLANSNQILATAPDGFQRPYKLDDSTNNIGDAYLAYVNGIYPQGPFFYDQIADKKYGGWVDYTSPGVDGRKDGDQIVVQDGLRLILALKVEGVPLVPGQLGPDGKLTPASEGPFRTITPQKFFGPPDQPSTNSNPALIWPYDKNADHNAGSSVKCATIIKVTLLGKNGEPVLPEGTTDIDTKEAGWNYVNAQQILVYGNINPLRTINVKLDTLSKMVQDAPLSFKQPTMQKALLKQLDATRKVIANGEYSSGVDLLQQMMNKTDGCVETGSPYPNDWITNCDFQKNAYYALHEMHVLLKMLVP